MGASFKLTLCLLLSFFAGSFLRRYLTTPIFIGIQTLCVLACVHGVAMLTISTAARMLCLWPVTCALGPDVQLVAVLLALPLTALGTGGLKSSVSGFRSDDQFGETKPQTARFVNWLFFSIRLGSLLAVAVAVLVYVQDTLGRPWGCAAAVFIVFLADTHCIFQLKKLAGVSIGVNFGGHALVLSLAGILAAVVLIAVSVRMTQDPTAFGTTTTFPGITCRHLAVVWLAAVSTAITALTGQDNPANCISLFVCILVGITLITAGFLGV
uniref:Uncharacterized protein n=1 Tax=Oryza brachyantha TaxID=4533 RepID=J3MQX1_ORYBR